MGSEGEEVKKTIEFALTEITERLIGNNDTVPTAEKINVDILQSTKYNEPSIDFSRCEEGSKEHSTTANVAVQLPSSKNISDTFEISTENVIKRLDASTDDSLTSRYNIIGNVIKDELKSVNLEGRKGMISDENNGESRPTIDTKTQGQLRYEAVIPISLNQDISATKEELVDETISNIQNIIDLSPEDHVDSLTVKAKKGPVNQSPKITISCCNTDEENDKA